MKEKDLLSLILLRTIIVIALTKKLEWTSSKTFIMALQASLFCDSNLLTINPKHHNQKVKETTKDNQLIVHIKTIEDFCSKLGIDDDNTILAMKQHQCTF